MMNAVGDRASRSWQFALALLWESGFRVGDLMDFSWADRRHIHPMWSDQPGVYPTIVIPSSQKNGRTQENRSGWVVNPLPMEYEITASARYLRPTDSDLRRLARRFSNRSIGRACHVSDAPHRLVPCNANRNRVGRPGLSVRPDWSSPAHPILSRQITLGNIRRGGFRLGHRFVLA